MAGVMRRGDRSFWRIMGARPEVWPRRTARHSAGHLRPDLSAEDVALGYKNLLEAERGFRDLKSTLELRPVYHRLEPRIRAHVLLCWLALLLIRVAERRTGRSWPTLARELGRLHAVNLTGPTGTVTQTNRAHHRPAGHSSGLRAHPTAPHNRPTPRLTCANTTAKAARACSDTPPTPTSAHRPRSTPGSAVSSTYELRNPGQSHESQQPAGGFLRGGAGSACDRLQRRAPPDTPTAVPLW
jgi:hypothetical protein